MRGERRLEAEEAVIPDIAKIKVPAGDALRYAETTLGGFHYIRIANLGRGTSLTVASGRSRRDGCGSDADGRAGGGLVAVSGLRSLIPIQGGVLSGE
jgi:hypothetical protein